MKQAETREAERIGRVALKAGLGEVAIEEAALQAAFEDIARRFRDGRGAATGRKSSTDGRGDGASSATVEAGAAAGIGDKA
ncbi:conjugal transfer protein TraC [Brucella endophytica]|uniref:Conjugal transfer protein TraC n=1 Tax=Brucella endophytica TaxID=1963359 RepID=A0A916SQ18_9HYPH|nr:conjugal transfer protein TraC [Brucella endophytica]